MKPKPDHFSLSDCRKTLTEHEHPLFTLTKSEMEAMVSRLEQARDLFLEGTVLYPARMHTAEQWLASLEAGK